MLLEDPPPRGFLSRTAGGVPRSGLHEVEFDAPVLHPHGADLHPVADERGREVDHLATLAAHHREVQAGAGSAGTLRQERHGLGPPVAVQVADRVQVGEQLHGRPRGPARHERLAFPDAVGEGDRILVDAPVGCGAEFAQRGGRIGRRVGHRRHSEGRGRRGRVPPHHHANVATNGSIRSQATSVALHGFVAHCDGQFPLFP